MSRLLEVMGFRLTKEYVNRLGFDAEKISQHQLNYIYKELRDRGEMSSDSVAESVFRSTLCAVCTAIGIPKLPKEKKDEQNITWN